jgi:hypothetical protein
MADKNYLEIFGNRFQEQGREAWLDASLRTLGGSYEKENHNADEAADNLIANHSFEELRTLAYSAYSFWYRPLLDYAKATPVLFGEVNSDQNSWSANELLKKLFFFDKTEDGQKIKKEGADVAKRTLRG